MTYRKFHAQFKKLAPRPKNPTIDRIIPVDSSGFNYGIKIPIIKDFVKNFYKQNQLEFKEAVNLADECFRNKITDEVVFGIELVAKYRQSQDIKFWRTATKWIEFLTNWENCDRLCGVILGKILRNNPQLIKNVATWTKHKFYWKRRCAIVSFIPTLSFEGRNELYQKSKFIKPILQICVQLGKDEALYVQKAVGWPIREITKWNGRQITFPYLVKNKDKFTSFVWHASLEKFNQQDKARLKRIYKKK